MSDVSQGLAWLTAQPWLVPVIGVLACGLIYAVGRRFLLPREDACDPAALFEAHFLRGVTKDRRVAPRRRGNPVEVELLHDVPGSEPIRGYVYDRSIGGLGILVDNPIPAGTVLRVRPKQGAEGMLWTGITVRFCRQSVPQYELGCQFHRTPNWGLLLQFG